MPIQFQFDVEKATQAVAYILAKRGGATKIPVLKLLFLADIDHLKRHGRPISGDHPYAMDRGPVLTETYALLCGKHRSEQAQELFDRHIRVDGMDVELVEPADYDCLSDSDKRSLNATLKKYGEWSANDLSKHTHNMPAYTRAYPRDAKGTSVPMRWEDVLEDASEDVRGMVDERQEIRRCLDR